MKDLVEEIGTDTGVELKTADEFVTGVDKKIKTDYDCCQRLPCNLRNTINLNNSTF